MKYYECGSLQDCIPSGHHLTEPELRDVASCCLLGLDYLHYMKIIHRVFQCALPFLSRISNQRICSFPIMD